MGYSIRVSSREVQGPEVVALKTSSAVVDYPRTPMICCSINLVCGFDPIEFAAEPSNAWHVGEPWISTAGIRRIHHDARRFFKMCIITPAATGTSPASRPSVEPGLLSTRLSRRPAGYAPRQVVGDLTVTDG
ncbi:hypothetical protein BKA25_004841 [Actinoalloteichus hymeniacidonis]|jgi:hypothetical protein|uniref:Uncharacterized protein n=1 Tax=Actinoalloteichus hymeniacidonis TaxID=340345 RepID=A0AAC9MVT1_9PSEU|nr:hypothetical protein TL08_03170 [Actinoalloteichus hymeniacidonis]MBB5910525.1 hypothetical protein [Actinoalloteichus hymeniacidonis]